MVTIREPDKRAGTTPHGTVNGVTDGAIRDRFRDVEARFMDVLLGDPDEAEAPEPRLREAVEAKLGEGPPPVPRLPSVIPDLFAALHDDATSVATFINRDPALAAQVIRVANSVYYRRGNRLVENLDQALLVLGEAGLQAAVAQAALLPLLAVDTPPLTTLGPGLWQHATRTAAVGQLLANSRQVDPFTANLTGLLHDVGHLALLRLAQHQGKRYDIPLDAGTARYLMVRHGPAVSRDVVESWDLPPTLRRAIAERATDPHPNPDALSDAGLVLCWSILGSKLGLLVSRELESEDRAQQLLVDVGVDARQAERVIQTAGLTEGNG